MTFGIETQKSFVDTWECDENNHLNIQFYWKRFGDAGQIFQQMMNREPRAWVDRHVRYHRELHAGTNTVVQSATPSSHACLVHVLSGGENNTVSATALDQFDNHDGGATPGLDQIRIRPTPAACLWNFCSPPTRNRCWTTGWACCPSGRWLNPRNATIAVIFSTSITSPVSVMQHLPSGNIWVPPAVGWMNRTSAVWRSK